MNTGYFLKLESVLLLHSFLLPVPGTNLEFTSSSGRVPSASFCC